jgi:hypothetical protein
MTKAKTTIKKVIVTRGTAKRRKVPDKIAYARSVKTTCATSAAFAASQPCKDAMSVWMTKTDALEAAQTDRVAKEVALAASVKTEAACSFQYDEAGNSFAVAVQTASNGDPEIATSMGMALRGAPAIVTLLLVPQGVRIVTLKTKDVSKLEWDAVPGAAMYIAQMSVDPATDASWVTLYGKGKTRALPPLVAGQHYLGRVCAIGTDGKPTGWSTNVSFIGK